jgi:protein SCO1/2
VIDSVFSGESIFNLTGNWHTQNNETIVLSALKGKTLVMVMIYTSCKAACPRLVADMRDIESKIPRDKLEKINFVLVSIDPETDDPKRLKAFAIANLMDAPQWTFLQGTKTSVQEFANVLAVKYKQISPMDFSHSNIISVFNTEGELIHQQEGLGVNNKETVEKIIETINK